MLYKTASPLPGFIHVTFELPAWIWATQITVVGDFNQWNPTALPMQCINGEQWQAEIELPYGGCYEFRYWVDGRWMTDYQTDSVAGHVYPSINSVLVATLPKNAAQIERTQRIEGAESEMRCQQKYLTSARLYHALLS